VAGTEPRILGSFDSHMNNPLHGLSALVPVHSLSEQHLCALRGLPEHVERALIRALYREWKNNPLAASHLSELCSRGLSSEFSLTQWAEQIVRMYDWLRQQDSTALFSDVLEYVSCAFEGSALQPGHNLDWYLTNYGFERSTRLG